MSDTPKPAPANETTQSPPAADEWLYANKLEKQIGLTKCVGARWFNYTDDVGAWREGTSDIHRPKAMNILPTAKRRNRIATELLRHLESRWQDRIDLFRGAIKFDDDAVLINVRNGVLSVRPDDVRLMPHTSTHYFTRCLCVPYQPEAQCTCFEQVLAESLHDEADRELILLCYGNFLLPDCRHETALVCYGEAGSGKSTISDPLTAIFGTAEDSLMTRLSMKQLCDTKSYSLPKLHYACLNLSTELQSITVDDSANFKTIVSGEPIEARPIYDTPFVMQPHCKLMFCANSLPRCRNGTDAEVRRMRFVRFDNQPAHPDVLLKAKLSAEAVGIFQLMVTHLQRVMTLDRIPMGGSHSQSVHQRFQVSNDPLGTFVRRHCRLAPDAITGKDMLNQSFSAYSQLHNLPIGVSESFFKLLYDRYPEVVGMRTSKGGIREQAVKGISLQLDAPMDVESVHI